VLLILFNHNQKFPTVKSLDIVQSDTLHVYSMIKRVYEVLSSIGLHTAGYGFYNLPPVTEELMYQT